MKFKKTIIFQMIIVLALSLMIPFQPTHAASLTDIPADVQKEVNNLIQRGIISGYPDNTFKPDNKVTREEVAYMIGKALNLKEDFRKPSFSDINPKSFGSGYIATAVENGIISGHTDGTFRPKDKITRGHISIMLERAFELKGVNTAVFSDVSPKDKNLYSAVDALYSNGVKTALGNGLFKPNEEINRAEFSVLVARSINPTYRQEVKVNEYVVNLEGTTLNVRSGPGMEHAVVGKLTNNTRVLTTGSNDIWQYMQTASVNGFVHKDYLVSANGDESIEAELPNKPELPKRHIAIDAGHGGYDPGAAGNGLVEKIVTLEVAKKVEKLLEKENVKVKMTRESDVYVGLEERVNIASKANVDAFVSIHMNSFSNGNASGTESFYRLANVSTKVSDSKQLTTFIQNRLYKALNTTNRGVKTANFAVLRTTFPSTLIELAFISNKSDAGKLGSEQYQDISAQAITAGIMDYYRWKER
ncbi:N-acetylmuramoyl-L-alanine amidase [Sporosarcina siberiensis]|uniref:N-acetylmuramoyl-L-alanine amidase n=1 Tax=Sporosarcina siberiensis TaxID=1365606 RepID=A0ABW4SJJ9_9BACL